jgi:hypothetical protein
MSRGLTLSAESEAKRARAELCVKQSKNKILPLEQRQGPRLRGTTRGTRYFGLEAAQWRILPRKQRRKLKHKRSATTLNSRLSLKLYARARIDHCKILAPMMDESKNFSPAKNTTGMNFKSI